MEKQTKGRTDGWMDGQIEGKCPQYTGLCPLLENSIKQGKGTVELITPLGNWFELFGILGATNVRYMACFNYPT